MKGALILIALTIVIMLFLVSATTRSAIFKDTKASFTKLFGEAFSKKGSPNQVIPQSSGNMTFNASVS